MNLRFMTILHNLKLKNIDYDEINIFDNVYISNSDKVKDATLTTNLFDSTLGVHSVNEFDGTVYLYIDVNMPHIVSKDQMDEVGNQYTFSYLRKAQSFVEQLWLVKDNNIYIRDGFLVAYDNNIDDGFTYKASLSAIYTKATKDTQPTVYSKSEIFKALEGFIAPKISDYEKDSFGGKYPNGNHFFKSYDAPRMLRAYYFILSARANFALPMKVIMYCTALECLFTTGSGEVTHKISERVALLVGTTPDSKLELFKLVKKAYRYRSTIIHGSVLKGEEDDLSSVTGQLDDLLRELIIRNDDVFAKNENELEDFFTKLLFEDRTINLYKEDIITQLV